MNSSSNMVRSRPGGLGPALALALLAVVLGGCEVGSFFDPSKTGRFSHTPTTIPILKRIDVIEPSAVGFGEATPVTREDLIPGDLTYTLTPGDLVTVQIYELFEAGLWHATSGRIDAGGTYRVPEIGDIPAAGLTPQQFEDRVTEVLAEGVFTTKPLVDVLVEAAGGLRYTIYGAVQSPGMYSLNTPDLRILDALAIAGGVPLSTRSVYVIRSVPLTEEVMPQYLQGRDPGGQQREPRDTGPEAPDIGGLIEQLENQGRQAPPPPPPGQPDDDIRPGFLGPVQVDIDDLIDDQPPADDQQPGTEPPPVDVDELEGQQPDARPGERVPFFDPQLNEWIWVTPEEAAAPADQLRRPAEQPAMLAERVIEIPFDPLKRGDASYNIVVRPGDRIYVEEAAQGVVYIEGEVLRTGVYTLPPTGGLTLSRLIAAAGGFGALAIPQRVDLTRVVGHDREATIRLDLAAIRQRTEPDVYIKPNDHIIIGTNFWATPLAVIRNGFRITYGFGFLLDRNFGNDVFGAPPGTFTN